MGCTLGLDARCWRELHAGALTIPRLSARCTNTRLLRLVNLEWPRRLVGAAELRKSVRVSKELDEVLLTESHHAEPAHRNRRQLGGCTSALVADHARASEATRSQAHESPILPPCLPALWRVDCLVRMTLFKGSLIGAYHDDRTRSSSIFRARGLAKADVRVNDGNGRCAPFGEAYGP